MQKDNRSLKITVTALSITLSSPAFQLALQMKLQVIPRRRSYSTDVRRRILLPSIYSVPDRASHGIIQYILYISFPNRDIENIIAFSGIFAKFVAKSPRSGIQAWPLPLIPYLTL
ncbi:hypothetical protein AVEN_133606-1 [Araneus ventricosus]|uniref:Uncharacterized protein n=1 Tax=Araneus ventricosus TaxID=182803 RepID=A0A4Y2JZ45_ARAVE|nr:hypothetical protein AVEN_133606-1 [Araneus ventricosus]